MLDTMAQQIISKIRTDIIYKADLGLGGNSNNPTMTELDVPLGLDITPITASTDNNVLEVKIQVAGSSIQGKVIREAGIYKDDGDGTKTLIHRANFSGIGPIASDETLEIFLILEVE